MKELHYREVFYGKNHANLVNKAIGTNFSNPLHRCWFDLSKFGSNGVIAWFVFMDGSKHGYPDGWWWRNILSSDGDEICEYNVADLMPGKQKLDSFHYQNGYCPYRICFQLDPYQSGNRYCCRFVGLFMLNKLLSSDGTAVCYKKVQDYFILGAKDEYSHLFLTNEDISKRDKRYLLPISKLGFSEQTSRSLRLGNVKVVADLLELGYENNSNFADEVNEKLFRLFNDYDACLKRNTPK